jgi:DNA-directed RNA polymerase subunit RPC12/RpoP
MNRQGNKIDINTYQPIGTKTIQCIDCGKDVEVDAKDNETCRCEECRRIYIRERDRLRKQRYRKNLSHSQF